MAFLERNGPYRLRLTVLAALNHRSGNVSASSDVKFFATSDVSMKCIPSYDLQHSIRVISFTHGADSEVEPDKRESNLLHHALLRESPQVDTLAEEGGDMKTPMKPVDFLEVLRQCQ
jgi:hypothetical protein